MSRQPARMTSRPIANAAVTTVDFGDEGERASQTPLAARSGAIRESTMTTEWLLLLLVVLLLAASAFFVAAEFSLIAARRTVIEPMAVNSSRARSTLKAMENV